MTSHRPQLLVASTPPRPLRRALVPAPPVAERAPNRAKTGPGGPQNGLLGAEKGHLGLRHGASLLVLGPELDAPGRRGALHINEESHPLYREASSGIQPSSSDRTKTRTVSFVPWEEEAGVASPGRRRASI
eukprot:scaffold1318_cov388-Prasinococcus_capsulatus_cf.AAC.78